MANSGLAEEQLRQSHKMEAIGQLAAGIAHEINTPIQYVSDNSVFLRESWTVINRIVSVAAKVQDEWRRGALSTSTRDELDSCFRAADIDYLANEIPRAIDETFEGARQVAKIVRAMNEFAHPASENKCACDLNQAIENTIAFSRNVWKYVARVETSLDREAPLVLCRLDEINQVLLNLIVNAAHAVGSSNENGLQGLGTIRVRTTFADGWITISVSDDGGGVPEDVRSRIFEPFFTTKPLGSGTGQGLAMARVIVEEQHGGRIWLESTAGTGTTFYVSLPVDPEIPA
ncbi:Signal transduction histidine kinase [Acidisarcina polymorpha]|uniref:histidine kinase n=1 Tax=Acidisarcina polymorpha TaxID=2211140 RepID=A0A2Z5G7A6_9BACT|nr:ATP-binding protein [Acidisarcina polymorpha]AXC14584.1 Signal transduction histidine kinase [Acidisarcina polymorpha]